MNRNPVAMVRMDAVQQSIKPGVITAVRDNRKESLMDFHSLVDESSHGSGDLVYTHSAGSAQSFSFSFFRSRLVLNRAMRIDRKARLFPITDGAFLDFWKRLLWVGGSQAGHLIFDHLGVSCRVIVTASLFQCFFKE